MWSPGKAGGELRRARMCAVAFFPANRVLISSDFWMFSCSAGHALQSAGAKCNSARSRCFCFFLMHQIFGDLLLHSIYQKTWAEAYTKSQTRPVLKRLSFTFFATDITKDSNSLREYGKFYGDPRKAFRPTNGNHSVFFQRWVSETSRWRFFLEWYL